MALYLTLLWLIVEGCRERGRLGGVGNMSGKSSDDTVQTLLEAEKAAGQVVEAARKGMGSLFSFLRGRRVILCHSVFVVYSL